MFGRSRFPTFPTRWKPNSIPGRSLDSFDTQWLRKENKLCGIVYQLSNIADFNSCKRGCQKLKRITYMYAFDRIGVVSGKAIFGPPLEEYWKKKLEEEATAKEADVNSS